MSSESSERHYHRPDQDVKKVDPWNSTAPASLVTPKSQSEARTRSLSPGLVDNQAIGEHLAGNHVRASLDPAQEAEAPEETVQPTDRAPVKWSELPRRDQLFILTLARLSEPVVQTSLGSYMFFMLKSFDRSLEDDQISSQAGLLTASFTFAQCLTAVLWGRLADKEWMGRKNVLLIGLAGTLVSSLGFGFSRSFLSAMFFRFLGGALNGNVGVMRTMISEIIQEKKYQPKAFLIMPITFNVGVLIGPLLGGWLQDPVHTFPRVFGPNTAIGGQDGVSWMRAFPYALPNIVSCIFLLMSLSLVFLGLEETHVDRRHRPDWGIRLRNVTTRLLCCSSSHSSTFEYTQVGQDQTEDVEMLSGVAPAFKTLGARPQLPYWRMFTKNVLLTFLTHGLFAMHLGSFHTLWFLFLSSPRAESHEAESTKNMPFVFGGGLGLSPATIGFAIGVLGALGLMMQFGVYSRVTHRLGLLQTYRRFLWLFPLVYVLAPYLAVVPTKTAPPHAADGIWIWMGICGLLFFIVCGRTFSLPIAQILINNCTPHPSVLSSIHGWGQSVSAGARTLGPIIWSTLYGVGLRHGVVGLAWWVLAAQATLACVVAQFLYEGSGHEIRLDGDP